MIKTANTRPTQVAGADEAHTIKPNMEAALAVHLKGKGTLPTKTSSTNPPKPQLRPA